MDEIHEICPKEIIPCKGLVILPLEAVNVTRPQLHRKTDWTFLSQVVPRELLKRFRRVTQILSGSEDVDPLVQDITQLFLV